MSDNDSDGDGGAGGGTAEAPTVDERGFLIGVGGGSGGGMIAKRDNPMQQKMEAERKRKEVEAKAAAKKAAMASRLAAFQSGDAGKAEAPLAPARDSVRSKRIGGAAPSSPEEPPKPSIAAPAKAIILDNRIVDMMRSERPRAHATAAPRDGRV